MGNEVEVSTPIYRKADVFYKDSACEDRFYDQKAAAILWRQKQKIDHPIKAGIQEGVVVIASFFGCGLAFVGVIALWGFSGEQGWRSHDELITVDSRNWANGEYKSCTSLNTKTASQTYLGCSSGLSGDAKEFKVRFYGLTYDESKPEASYHNWKCRKNGDSDPTITCEIETPEVH